MEGEKDQGLFPAFDVMKDPPILFPFMINNPVDQLQGQSSYGDQRLRHQVWLNLLINRLGDHNFYMDACVASKES
jgi:hypothetical protein